jgi:hypothetical protein
MVTELRWLQLAPDVEESVNGGQGFSPYTTDLKVSPPLQAEFVPGGYVGYVVAGVTVWRTDDGGAHWTTVSAPSSPGRVASPTPSPASPARTSQACLSSPPPAASWQTYSDVKYGFVVSYPRGYTFEQAGRGNPDIGWLAAYRAVDDCYLGGYPGAQVEISVFTRDADPLTAWVTKHSRALCTDAGGYFWAVSNLRSTTAAARAAVTFDMNLNGCPELSGVAHVTAFVLKSGSVFAFDWWSSDAGYAPTMHSIAEQMLASVKD